MDWWNRLFSDSTKGRIVTALRRGPTSVEELAAALDLTDNAIRAQLVALERDGIVVSAGTRRGGVGKPATLYGIDPGAQRLFSTAYPPVLAALIAELAERLPHGTLVRTLRRAGQRLADGIPQATGSREARAQASAQVLESLGALVTVGRAGRAVTITGAACPLADAVAANPAVCVAVEEMLSNVAGEPVTEHCDRSAAPRCRFTIGAAPG